MASIDNFEFAHQHRTEVAWMSQNTCTLPMHSAILESIRNSLEDREFNSYPFKRGLFGLPETILEDLRLDGFEVLMTNGGIEGEQIATRALLNRGEEVVGTDPAFLPIHAQIEMSGASAKSVDIYRKPYVVTPQWANEAITPATKAMCLIDPDNPMGLRVHAVPGQGPGRGHVGPRPRPNRRHHVPRLQPGPRPRLRVLPGEDLAVVQPQQGPGPRGDADRRDPRPRGAHEACEEVRHEPLRGERPRAHAALAALQTKKEWLPGIRKTCEKNQRTIKGAVDKPDGATLPVIPSKASLFVIDIAATGVNPETLEERLLRDHLVHGCAGSYLSKLNGSRFFRVSFTVPEEDAKRFADAFPNVMEQLRK